jgi:hypothetical protein
MILFALIICNNFQLFANVVSKDITKKITFVNNKETRWQIFFMNQDGSNLTN